MNQYRISTMRRHLVVKIFAGHVVTILLVVVIIGLFSSSWHKRALRENAEIQLLSLARTIAVMPPGEIMKNASALAQISQCGIAVISPTGRIILDTNPADPRDNYYDRPEIRAAAIKGQGVSVRYSPTLQEDVIHVALAQGAGEKTGYVRLSKPVSQLHLVATQVHKAIILVTLLVVTLALILSALYFRRLLAPLRAIEAHTRGVIQNGRLTTLMIDSDDDLGRISRNINNMALLHQQEINQSRKEKSKIEAIFASFTDGVMVTGADNSIESYNNGMLNIIGPNLGDIIGKKPIEVLRSVDLQEALTQFQQTGKLVTRELAIGAEGKKILEVNITAIKDLPASDMKTLLVFHDVTEIRKLERLRADFVASLTHEIKTPLTALVGFSETLIRDMPVKEVMEEFLKKIYRNGQRLNRLVDDLLIIFSSEQGERKPRLEEFSVAEVIDEALALLVDQIQHKSLLVENKVSPCQSMWADRDDVFRIFLNVLENAVKFTPVGRVEVAVVPDERGYLAISITDTGIGIPQHEIPRLGKRFYRVDKTRQRESGGSGLGLSIVKHLLRLHQGWMEIESKVSCGTRVTLYFPPRKTA